MDDAVSTVRFVVSACNIYAGDSVHIGPQVFVGCNEPQLDAEANLVDIEILVNGTN